MEIWRLRLLGISFFLFCFVGTRSSTNGVGMGYITLRMQLIGGGVSLCTGSSRWPGMLSRGTYEIVPACMRVVSVFSTCIYQPGSWALKEGDDVTALSSMRG
jgi:hypothetical protein